MSVETLQFAEPFFTVRLLMDEANYNVSGRSIILNLSEESIAVQDQKIGYLSSIILCNTPIRRLKHCIVIERFDENPNQEELFEDVRKTWRSALDVRK